LQQFLKQFIVTIFQKKNFATLFQAFFVTILGHFETVSVHGCVTQLAYRSVDLQNPDTRKTRITAMDESVGRVIRALKAANQYDDTIFVFSSDNGGQCLFGGNNYPFRGRKFSLWQGGVRSAGFIAGPGIEPGKSYDNLFHVVDWMPTLLDAIGVKRYGKSYIFQNLFLRKLGRELI